ncbi:Ribonuclease H-like superfamily [Sesbania bispinosa]|nr:Ribonuclease H-like superfamily [Sesbania bispinosa]
MAFIAERQYGSKHVIYTVNLHGREIMVTVTSAASVVRRWLSATLYFRRYYHHLNRLVVGLGVQWTPGGPDPLADTLQLCVGRRCLIFQLARSNTVPRILRKFLRNADHTFVGFWNHLDRHKLETCEHCFEMSRNPLDLRLHAVTDDDEDLSRASVPEIVQRCLGYEVEQSREISMSNWGKKRLSDDQVVYACVDAHCAFLIGRNIRAWDITD